ncbi:hypothetical protein GURASL_03920 [Geotalea uraniireducens]|uniref:Major royal jelly protein n=1 Tax=Geotalea uraniireducens TaxID=351604 RepID=A0ABN6VMR6_9BACT|nr:L-dopachrome tautomerase-related protein [Geotalea uraniireducens]BDV41469.1 hypothetical protein GURASL_03920 [Geotalea uraniireducens]
MRQRQQPVRSFFCAVMLATLCWGGCALNPMSHDAARPIPGGALYEFPLFNDQVTGIALSATGRLFVNFPRWGKDPLYSVAEVLPDGTTRPFPDEGWNRWGRDEATHPEAHFVCVQSVFIDRNDRLWILDAASPGFSGVVPHGAKLLKVNIDSATVEQVIPFGPEIALSHSYLNDVRIDTGRNIAYLTDSGTGALVVVDLATGTSRRLLADHPSTKAEPDYVPKIDGRELRDSTGQVPQINADGIALDPAGEYLYYHALTARTLYRIKTVYLRDPKLSPTELAKHVERLTETGAADGMVMDGSGNLFVTSLEDHAVKEYRPGKPLATIVQDSLIHWPDSLAISPDGYLYITDSQINLSPRFNFGKDLRIRPYRYFKSWLLPLETEQGTLRSLP